MERDGCEGMGEIAEDVSFGLNFMICSLISSSSCLESMQPKSRVSHESCGPDDGAPDDGDDVRPELSLDAASP